MPSASQRIVCAADARSAGDS